MIANPEVDIKQCSGRTVEEIDVLGVALVELVTGLGVRVGVEPGALGGEEQGAGEEREERQQAERAERAHHILSPPGSRSV